MEKKYLDCGLEAANAGASVLLHYWGKLKEVECKSSSSDLVTVADRESEKIIIEVIKASFPEHGILGEESGLEDHYHSDYQWIIDPLDGTTNYTHSYPMVSISIALYHKNEPLIGIVYNPILQELFQAASGSGAFLNGKKIHVSSTCELSRSLLATGFAYDRLKTPETNYSEFACFTQLTQGVRRAGSAALDLAYVASGRLDGYWERGIQPWDMAAGLLLVTEAGGTVTAYDQSPIDLKSGKILASNAHLHSQISMELLKLKR